MTNETMCCLLTILIAYYGIFLSAQIALLERKVTKLIEEIKNILNEGGQVNEKSI